MLPMAGRTAGLIKTKLGIGTHVDPGSVLVKVKVIWRHLVNANKTPYRGPQGPREARRAETTPSRGRVLTAMCTISRILSMRWKLYTML